MSDEEVIVDQPEVDTEVVETDVAQPEVEEVETPEGETPEAKAEGDARSLPRDVQKALKTLRDNPETAKIARVLNDSYFREQAYSKFGKPADIAALATTVERLGGQEGIVEIEQKLSAISRVDEEIAEGNPAYLDDIIESSPEGFKKLVPAALNKLYALDKAAYGRAVAPILYNTLKSYQLPAIMATLQASQDPAAKTAFEHLSRLNADLEEEVRNAPRQADDKPDKAKEEWGKIHGEKHRMELQGVGSQTIQYQRDLVSKSLTPLLKTRTLSTDAKADLNSGISGEIEKLLKSDTAYQSNVGAAVEKIKQAVIAGKPTQGQKEALSRYINAKMDEIAPRAVKAVWSRRYGSTAVKTKPAANGVRTAANPKILELDYWSLKTEEQRNQWRAAKAAQRT